VAAAAAEAQGRSMFAEVVMILRAALQDAQLGAGRSQAIDQLRAIRHRAHLGTDARLAKELVREDRE
jgi:plasmid stability protein